MRLLNNTGTSILVLNKLTTSDNLMEMANLPLERTGLRVSIWSEYRGKFRNKPDKEPRVKIGKNMDKPAVTVSIERTPVELYSIKNLKQSEKNYIKKAKEYIGRNYDLFLNHYNGDLDDISLVLELNKRGEYKL